MISFAKISYVTLLLSAITTGDAHSSKSGKSNKSGKSYLRSSKPKVLDVVSPATTFPNVPKQCRGVVPDMLGEYCFFGFRLEGSNTNGGAPDQNLQTWEDGTDLREIGGLEWVPWVNGPYYLLAINSPAGLVQRFCTFDAKDNRTSVCTGMDERDETVTETLYMTETDEKCRASSFSIVTTKAYAKDPTAISNMFVDKVQGERTCFGYPEDPSDVTDFECDD